MALPPGGPGRRTVVVADSGTVTTTVPLAAGGRWDTVATAMSITVR
jgi:hypothetical protein